MIGASDRPYRTPFVSEPATDPGPKAVEPSVDEGTARTWVEIDLARLADNVRALKARLPDTTEVLMTVKADAYGHGLVPVARAAVAAGVWGFGVAALDEAAALREAGIDRPIVDLFPILPEEADRAVALGVTPSITAPADAEAVSAAAARVGHPVRVHVEIDTGMGRTGVRDRDAAAFVAAVAELPGLEVDGIFTHFATADEPDRAYTERQLDRFDALLEALAERGIRPPRVHAANSAAALRFSRAARTLARPGIALYGAPGEIANDADDGRWTEDGSPFAPVLAWRARVVAVKELDPGETVGYHRSYAATGVERIAVLAVGYGDGWPLGLSGRGRVLLRGREVPIRGAVCMDVTMVDATPFPDLEVGEVATLVGRQGDARRTVEEVAAEAGLISYAVLTGISPRVRRRYSNEAEGSAR